LDLLRWRWSIWLVLTLPSVSGATRAGSWPVRARTNAHAHELATRTMLITLLTTSARNSANTIVAEVIPEMMMGAQQAAAIERAQQAARQDIAEKREAADRVAAEILEEEEREQAAQTKVRLAPPSPHILSSTACSCVVSDAAFLSHG
jgi:hypothetical protein